MLPEIRKAVPMRLRAIGLNERWLQDRIEVEFPQLSGHYAKPA